MMKRSLCAHCKRKLDPGEKIHQECIEGYAEAQAAKAERAAAKKVRAAAKAEREETRQRQERAKTTGQRKAEAQAAINKWIVHVRDKDLPCISCGRHHQGMYHAGHYRSRGSAPHLALDQRNLQKQCAPCNLHLHGNLIEYRRGLIERYGLAYVEALEADQVPRHLSPDEIDAIRDHYRKLVREAQRKDL